MKDAHLFAALDAAVQRFGTSELPDDAEADASRPRRRGRRARRRTPGWVSIREIEACQPPNTYPRFGRRVIKVRCAQLARVEEGPVLEMRLAGLRTWVRYAPQPLQGAGDDGVAQDARPPVAPADAPDGPKPPPTDAEAEAASGSTTQGGVA